VRRAADLPRVGGGADPAPRARLAVGGVEKSTPVAKRSTEPVWGHKLEWMAAAADDTLEVTVWDAGLLGGVCLGMVEVDLAKEIAAAPMQPVREGRGRRDPKHDQNPLKTLSLSPQVLRTWFLEEVPADALTGAAPPASVTLQVQWVPFDFEADA